MSTPANEGQNQLHRRLAACFLCMLTGVLFLSYPLALVPAGLVPAPHELSVPVTVLLTLAALPVLASASLRLGRGLWLPLAVFVISLGLSLAQWHQALAAHLQLLGLVAIPLAVAVAWRAFPGITVRRVAAVMFWLWLLNVALGLWALHVPATPVGLSGNPNWYASLLLALLPWSVLRVHAWLAGLPRAGRWLAVGVLVGWPTLVLLLRCHSRAAWLAIAVYVLLLTFHRLQRWPGRALFLVLLCLSAGVALLCWTPRLVAAIRADVRLPLWGRTVAMMRDHDVLAGALLPGGSPPGPGEASHRWFGVGAGRFTRLFTPYRATSTYHRRLVAAPVTVHPHNELLNIGAQIGLAAALAWAVLLLPLLRDRADGPWLSRCAAASALAVVVPGMFDQTLIQPPGNLVGLAALGLCWQGSIETRTPGDSPWRRVMTWATAAMAAGFGLWHVVIDWRSDCWRRRAEIEARMHADQEASVAAYRKAAELTPNDVAAQLSAGTSALEQLGKPLLALPFLQRAATLDPNYGHLNAQLGKAYGMLGRKTDALTFFGRERRLFPGLPEAHQRYFSALFLAGRYGELPAVDHYLRGLYRERVQLALPPAQRSTLPAEWLRRAQRGDPEAAPFARRLCMPIDTTFIDPLFFFVTVDEPWPNRVLRQDFGPLDVAYWQELTFLRRLARGVGNQASPAALLASIRERVTITPGDDGFLWPSTVWREGRSDPVSAAFLFCNAADQCGWPSVALLQPGGSVSCLVFTTEQAVLCDLSSGRTEPVPAVDGHVAHVLPGGTKLRFCFFPQQFLLKNQILGVLVQAFGSGAAPRFAVPPTIRLAQILMSVGIPPGEMRPAALAEFCLDAPWAALRGVVAASE